MAAKKKILVICQHFWPESFRINDICDFLVDSDCEIDVLCGIPNYPQGKFYPGYSLLKNRRQQHNGVSIERVFEIPRGNNSFFRIFVNYISFPMASLFHLPRLLRRDYDRIFIYQLSPVLMAVTGILLGKIKRIDTTMYVLDLWPENLFSVLNPRLALSRMLVTHISHWHYRRVNKLVALSQKMKNRLVEVSHIAPEKVLVLPQVCEKLYETDVHDEGLASRFRHSFNIVFAGNLSPAQSFETIIEAAQQLKAEGFTDICWVIVGDGMSRAWLVDEVNRRKLTDSFVFEGLKPMQDIPKYNTIADILIGCLVKSDLLDATIPAKVMSYFAAGKPIVLAMDGEVQTLVNDVIACGYAGPTGDAATLAGNIKKVYHLSPAQRKAMGDRGRAYHFKHFERNMNLAKLRDFILG